MLEAQRTPMTAFIVAALTVEGICAQPKITFDREFRVVPVVVPV
jgi:hypothetical protein